MRVLSVFDGIGVCGYVLKSLNINISAYYISEIDHFARSVSTKNLLQNDDKIKIINLGNIEYINFHELKDIDLVAGGSPCENLSYANIHTRHGLKGEKSKLFYYFVKAINIIKPKYFFFENVASMVKENRLLITKELGVNAIEIDSKIFVPQHRRRLYWTNITDNPLRNIINKHIDLDNIMQKDITDINKYIMIKNNYEYVIKSLEHNNIDINTINSRFIPLHRRYMVDGKEITVKRDLIINTLTKVYLDTMLLDKELKIVRRLTEIERERLQMLPDDYTKYDYSDKRLSMQRREELTGNCWTAGIIAEFFKYIKK